VQSLPGRPTKFTPALQAQIIELVAAGNFLDVACKAVGIAPRTLRHWRQQYRDGDSAVSEYAEFFAALEKALAVAETAAISRIRSGGLGWQGSAWFLERRYPQRWARKPAGQETPDRTVVNIICENGDAQVSGSDKPIRPGEPGQQPPA
jgi:hypothetical protein